MMPKFGLCALLVLGLLGMGSLASANEVQLVVGPVSDSGEVNVYIHTDTRIAGFQFTLAPADGIGTIEVSKGAGGVAQRAGFTVSTGQTGTVIGISMSGNTIEPTEDTKKTLLTTLYLGNVESFRALDSALCLRHVVIAGQSATKLKTTVEGEPDCKYDATFDDLSKIQQQ